MDAWQPAASGSGGAANFGGVLPSLSGPGPGNAALVVRPSRPSATVAPVPIGPPGETGTPPRVAFVNERPVVAANHRPQRFGKASVLGACVFEAAVVVPTVHMEVQFAKESNEPWSLLLRLLIATVRLYPVVLPCLRSAWRGVACCRNHWCQGPVCRRVLNLICLSFTVLFCPEVRWGVAITLDMWYLLTTPLNKGLSRVPCVVLLAANIILCFVDTLTLIMMLAVKSSEELDQPPERDSYARPRPVKLGVSDLSEEGASKFDPTCIICLSDFKAEDDILQLPCEHTFHQECITKWLSRSRHCPLRCPPVVLPPRTSRQQTDSSSSVRSGP